MSPIISGFASPTLEWRWTFWIGLILIGACWPPLLLLPETFGPVLLAVRNGTCDGTLGNRKALSKGHKTDLKGFFVVILARPVRMLLFEPIVTASSLYMSLVYAIFYMYFQAYPIVFKRIYNLPSDTSSLMFLPIGLGACVSLGIFEAYGLAFDNAQKRGKPWTKREEAKRVPLAYLGGPLFVVALFWLGWTARSDIHWIIPALAGIPFGTGLMLIFIALLNYVADAYDIYSASALAATSCCRSVTGAALTIAAHPMYEQLGVAWTSSLLGFLSCGMCFIPFVFMKYGHVLRSKSNFCSEMKEKRASLRSGQAGASVMNSI